MLSTAFPWIFGATIVGSLVYIVIMAVRYRNSGVWPTADGLVETLVEIRSVGNHGPYYGVLSYSYEVADEYYSGEWTTPCIPREACSKSISQSVTLPRRSRLASRRSFTEFSCGEQIAIPTLRRSAMSQGSSCDRGWQQISSLSHLLRIRRPELRARRLHLRRLHLWAWYRPCQALLFGNRDLLLYAAVVWMAFQIFVLLYEEPVLRKTYAAEYEEFCRNVPRWIPRLSAWHTPQSR